MPTTIQEILLRINQKEEISCSNLRTVDTGGVFKEKRPIGLFSE
jgi:hypothetical protein